MKHYKYLFAYLSVALLFSCGNSPQPITIGPENFHNTVDKLTTIMVHDIFSPPQAARTYAYPSIAAYEALFQNHKQFVSLTGQLNQLKKISHDSSTITVNTKLSALIAYMDVAKELVFSKKTMTDYRDSLYNIWEQKNHQEFLDAKAQGLKISNHIISWLNTDQYAETRTMPEFNILSADPSRWEPTGPAYMEAIEPHWNKIRPLLLDSAAQYKPNPPPTFSLNPKSKFWGELLEVFTIKKDINKVGDTSEKLQIAKFWDCNPYVSINKGHFMFAAKKITPGAHWIGICKIAAKKQELNFENTVFAYTKTAVAINDAFISCWDEKYRSNLIRPETLIHKYLDVAWTPALQTPPFPEYTSGHSVISTAAAEVLTAIFGDEFKFEDTTEEAFGLGSREYNSFKSAAAEAAISRLYGGIHYRSAVEEGEKQGKLVGAHVNNQLVFKR